MSFDAAVNRTAHYIIHSESYSSEHYELTIRPLRYDELVILRTSVSIFQDLVKQGREIVETTSEGTALPFENSSERRNMESTAHSITLEVSQNLIASDHLERIFQAASSALCAAKITSRENPFLTISVAPDFLNFAKKNQNYSTNTVAFEMKSAIYLQTNARAMSEPAAILSHQQTILAPTEVDLAQNQATINNLVRYISARDGISANQILEGNVNDDQSGANEDLSN